MKNKSVFLLKGILISKLMSFKQSLLFYPIIFAIGSIILFLITSNIDRILNQQVDFNVPYINSLIFTGGADASKSILSAIVNGWVTILGITFSVTLVTLQLSSTKYTSHIISKFEEDKVNQLTLAWFISVVLYSMLVLKTVRTGNDGITFIPIIGVNVAVILAIVALFILVIFLNNISSYLRPNILIFSIVQQIIHSIKPFEKRKKYDTTLLLDKKFYKDGLLFELRSTQKGICSYIAWEKIYHNLQEFSKIHKKSDLYMEWYKSLGDWIEKDSLIATIYEYNKDGKLQDKNSLNANGKNNQNNYSNILNKDKSFEQRIISYIYISKDRDIAKDPAYGIELLGSLAVKSINPSDIDVVNSCITGLFSILVYISKSNEFLGIPFTLETKIDNNKSDSNTTALKLIINPQEIKISDSILLELSIILEKAISKHHIIVAKHFVKEYISSSRILLEDYKINEFERYTEWCAHQIAISIESFQKQFQVEMINPIMDFKKDLGIKYPHLVDSFAFYMRNLY